MEKVIVFDFDKTLTNYDTTLPFFMFCCKENHHRIIFIPLILFSMVLNKFGILSTKNVKKLGLILVCPKKIEKFVTVCNKYSKQVKLNNIYYNIFRKYERDSKILVASGSFSHLLQFLFPNVTIIGTTLIVDESGKIRGISDHPLGKAKAIKLISLGFNDIDEFYTDSFLDLPTSKISKKTIFVKHGKVMQNS